MQESASDKFFALTPERMLQAIESIGVRCTGRFLMLNSLENRVVEAEIEVSEPLTSASERFRVAKFYRPERWTREQIQEEHDFIFELLDKEIPVVAPIRNEAGESLFQIPDAGILYAVFAKERGRNPQELTHDQYRWLGRLLARMHAIGQTKEAKHRITLSVESYGQKSLDTLLSSPQLSQDWRSQIQKQIEYLISLSRQFFEGIPLQRIHGDCHLGNIVWNDEGPRLVDFDDSLTGPVVQDMWLLFSGRDEVARKELDTLLEGYEQFRSFPRSSLKLIEPLRTLRIIHYAAWIARRWQDPIFQRTFSNFGSSNYWREFSQQLEEQQRMLEDTNDGWSYE